MSDEDIRARAAEAVREHLDINEKTRIRTNLRNAVYIIAAIVGATAAVCTCLNRISNSQDRMEAAMLYKVPEAQLTAWANALDRANRNVLQKDTAIGLIVPDPTLYRPQSPVRNTP